MYNIFIILLFFALIFPFDTKKGNGKLFLPLSFIVLFFFSAFVFHGWYSDYGRYYMHVLASYDISWSLLIQQKGILNFFLYKVVALLFHDPLFYFIITSGFILSSYFIFVRRFFYNEKFFVIAFFCTYGYSQINNIIRQSMASSIILFGVMFLLDCKKIKAIVCFFIACLIHDSAILIMPLLFLFKLNFTRKTLIAYVLVTAISVPLVVFFLPYIQLFFYSDYVGESYGLAKANILNVSLILPVVVSVIILISMANSDYLSTLFNNKMLINIILHGSMLYIFFIIIACGYAHILARFANYFIPFALLAVDRSMLLIKERNVKFVYYMGICLFLCMWFLTMQYAKGITAETTFIWQVENRPVIESSL